MSLSKSIEGRLDSVADFTMSKKCIGELAVFALVVVYFCDDIVASLLFRFFGSDLIAPIYNSLFFFLVAVSLATRRGARATPIVVCYGLVFASIFLSLILHPEYSDWFFSERYGLSAQFLTTRGAIWAFLVVALVPSRRCLFRSLAVVGWLLLIYQVIRYGVSAQRGYWEEFDRYDNPVRQSYSLYFGYETLFPASYFGAKAILGKVRWCYLPFAIGVFLVVMGGSRGPFVFIGILIVLCFAFRCRGADVRVQVFSLATLALLLAMAITGQLVDIAAVVSNAVGIESRTLTSLFEGTLQDANGREAIYTMVFDLIRDGGPFGYGVYGERTTVGQYYAWGYAHNLFLEIFVAFGYLGGTVLSGIFLWAVIRTFRRCESLYDQVVFVTFLTCSLKLLISDSFWYLPQFWALLAIMAFWRYQTGEMPSAGANPSFQLSCG